MRGDDELLSDLLIYFSQIKALLCAVEERVSEIEANKSQQQAVTAFGRATMATEPLRNYAQPVVHPTLGSL
jgi:hypothetical protein